MGGAFWLDNALKWAASGASQKATGGTEETRFSPTTLPDGSLNSPVEYQLGRLSTMELLIALTFQDIAPLVAGGRACNDIVLGQRF